MNKILEIARKKNITQDVIADHLGCDRKSVYNRMKQPKKLSAENIVKLAVLLDRSPRNLFSLIINN